MGITITEPERDTRPTAVGSAHHGYISDKAKYSNVSAVSRSTRGRRAGPARRPPLSLRAGCRDCRGPGRRSEDHRGIRSNRVARPVLNRTTTTGITDPDPESEKAEKPGT